MDERDDARGGPDDEAGADIRAEASEVLSEALEWQLTPARWVRVDEMVDAIVEAHDADDEDALWDAIADLELAGPMRITTRIGEGVPEQPPPEHVRDRIVRIIHTVGHQRAAEHGDGGVEGAGPPAR